MNNRSKTQGFLKTIFLIGIGVAALFYFDINVRNTIDSVLASDIYQTGRSLALDTLSYMSEKIKAWLK
jgi:hypothetical protein